MNNSTPFVDLQRIFMAIKSISDGEGAREEMARYLR